MLNGHKIGSEFKNKNNIALSNYILQTSNNNNYEEFSSKHSQ